ncbi:MAG: sodium-translocating pyrophosphatase [Patescibacteria group bacterium]|nr:sodium-translocating pyrophosphatase [Patescibacteria group bacterium]
MIILFSSLSALSALVIASIWALEFKRGSVKNKKVREITGFIRSSAKAYLAREYRAIAVVAAVIFVALFFLFSWKVAAGFLVGAIASAAAGYIGMIVSVHANGAAAEAAGTSEVSAFRVALRSGAVTGFMVAGLALLVLSLFYYFIGDFMALIGLGFGGSLVSIFARIGGGIFTKAADVGADLVGKVEAGIPEDDPRNPAVIADNVGDNVGDCAGMAADLFETYIISFLSAMLLGSLLFRGVEAAILFPLAAGGVGIIATMLGVFLSRLVPYTKVMKSLYAAVIISVILAIIMLFPIIYTVFSDSMEYSFFQLYGAVLIGFVLVIGMFAITDYYTSKEFRPVKRIAKASLGGHATNVIAGLGVGFEATAAPVILIAAGIFLSFWLAGIYGIALAVVGMLSLAGVVVAVDAFGPVADNAGGIAEMAGLPEKTREVTDSLDSAGNTTKAVTKGYAIASAGLAALVLFAAFKEELSVLAGREIIFALDDPNVIIGLFLGGVVSYLFVSLLMASVGKTAQAVVEEVRRQFREIPGLREGKAKPDYEKAVDIVTKASLREMVLPALLPIVFPIAVGFILGPEALGGLLVGGIIVGIFLALSMTSGGGAWDNAKKLIEDGEHGGKGSDAHMAAVTGDTIGDPFKDTAGPAINPMIKVLNIVALLIIAFII